MSAFGFDARNPKPFETGAILKLLNESFVIEIARAAVEPHLHVRGRLIVPDRFEFFANLIFRIDFRNADGKRAIFASVHADADLTLFETEDGFVEVPVGSNDALIIAGRFANFDADFANFRGLGVFAVLTERGPEPGEFFRFDDFRAGFCGERVEIGAVGLRFFSERFRGFLSELRRLLQLPRVDYFRFRFFFSDISKTS